VWACVYVAAHASRGEGAAAEELTGLVDHSGHDAGALTEEGGESVTRVLQECHKSVTSKSQVSCKSVTAPGT
jgi:hypothetical protein